MKTKHTPYDETECPVCHKLLYENKTCPDTACSSRLDHTPTPWKYEEGTKTIRAVPTNYWIASMNSFEGAVDNKANADFIVRAVNSHEELLMTAKTLLEYMTDNDTDDGYRYQRIAAIQALQKAIAKAEGK